MTEYSTPCPGGETALVKRGSLYIEVCQLPLPWVIERPLDSQKCPPSCRNHFWLIWMPEYWRRYRMVIYARGESIECQSMMLMVMMPRDDDEGDEYTNLSSTSASCSFYSSPSHFSSSISISFLLYLTIHYHQQH